MRYDAENSLTAAEVINSFNEKIWRIFFGNTAKKDLAVKFPKIVGERKGGRILTTFELIEIIKKQAEIL